MSSMSFGRQDITFGGNSTYPLTTGYVASDPISIKFVKKASVYGYYTPGAGGTGNSVEYIVEFNPFYPKEDPGNLYWAPVGRWIDTGGTYTEEPGAFVTTTATTAATLYQMTPLDIIDPSAAQIRVRVKEVVAGGAAGSIKMMLGSNTIN